MIHHSLSAYRVRREWYDLPADLITGIKTVTEIQSLSSLPDIFPPIHQPRTLRGYIVEFSLLLKQFRVASGMSIEQLSQFAGMTEQRIDTMEGGRGHAPRLDEAYRLALALGIPLADLLPEVTLEEPAPARPVGRPRKREEQPAAE